MSYCYSAFELLLLGTWPSACYQRVDVLSQLYLIFLVEKYGGGKNRGRERSAASMLLLRVRENMYDSSSSSTVWGLGCIGLRHTAFIDDA